MIKKYEHYKDSGVEWLGEIPEHWETKKVKYLFYIGRGRVIAQTELDDNGKYPVFSSQTLNDGVLGFINTYDFDCTQITWTTDGANAGTVFLRRGKHNCTNVCGTLQPSKSNFSIEFIKYILEFATQFYKRPDTNGAKIMNAEMAEIFLTFPPLPEQTAIAKFLDDKTEKIDQAIGIKKQQIALLKERKQILIHKAVTGQLIMENGKWIRTPKEKMKDSGVEWIGEIPEHWEVCHLKWLSKIYAGGTPDKANMSYWRNGTIPWIASGEVNQDIVTRPTTYITELGFKNSSARWIKRDSLIVALAGQGKTKGMVAYIDFDTTGNQSLAALRTNKEKMGSKYLYVFLKAAYNELRGVSGEGKRDGLNLQKLGELDVPIPPLSEQKEIAQYIETASAKIATAISIKEQEIEKLQEYKSSLINSVVTGKVKIIEN